MPKTLQSYNPHKIKLVFHDFDRKMGTYGNITPGKLHKDGQLTACRLSTFLNENHNKNIELWFIDCDNKEKIKQIKSELIDAYNPEVNRR